MRRGADDQPSPARQARAGRPVNPPSLQAAAPGAGASWRPALRNGVALGALIVIAFAVINRSDLHGMAGVLHDLPACVAISAMVHLPQLLLTALAWRVLMCEAIAPSLPAMALLRWLRESAGTLVPAGGLVGQVAAARLLARRGVPAELAGATATMDMTIETAAQVVFTLAGLALLLDRGSAEGTVRIAAVGVALVAAGAAGLVALPRLARQRWLAGPLRLLAGRLPPPWRRGIGGIHSAVLCLHAERGRLGIALVSHLAAWLLGALEVVGVLALLGRQISPADGLIIESMAQALRTAGFMLPGAVGVQEGAIVGAAALVGVPAGPALTAALVRRTREVLMAVPGLLVWQRSEAAARQPPRQPVAVLSAGDNK